MSSEMHPGLGSAVLLMDQREPALEEELYWNFQGHSAQMQALGCRRVLSFLWLHLQCRLPFMCLSPLLTARLGPREGWCVTSSVLQCSLVCFIPWLVETVKRRVTRYKWWHFRRAHGGMGVWFGGQDPSWEAWVPLHRIWVWVPPLAPAFSFLLMQTEAIAEAAEFLPPRRGDLAWIPRFQLLPWPNPRPNINPSPEGIWGVN